MGAGDDRDEPGKTEAPQQDKQPSRSYEFSIAGQQLMRCKSKRVTPRKLSISEVATVTVGAKYKEGSYEREVIIPKVPAFLYDCASVLYSRVGNSSEIFRKSGSQKRMNDFVRKHTDVHVLGCSFENSGLSDLDVSGLFKLYLRQHLEPTLFAGDPILDDIIRILEEHQCVNFDLDISPELGTLIFVIKFLHSLCLKHPQSQQLTAANLAILFAPGIIQHQKAGTAIDPRQAKEHIYLVQKMIENSFKLGVHIADTNLHRVRSTSISTDRSKNYDCSRRSSSVLGRFMKYMAKDRPKRVHAAPYARVKPSLECSPEVRISRPLARGSTRMRREDVIASFEKAGEINNRISLKDTVFCGTGSSTSPFTRCSMSTVPFDEEKRRQQIQNSSLTTLPPGESTFNCNNGATIRNTLPVQDNGLLDDNFLLSPELDVSLTNAMSPKRIPLDSIFIQPPKEPSTATIYDKTLATPKVETIERTESAKSVIQDDFLFKKPELSVPRPRTHKIEVERLAATRTTYKSLLSLPPEVRKPPAGCGTTQAAEVVHKSQPARRRRSSGLGFGSSDMVDLIRSSSDQETLTEAANVLSSNRPSIALLKQKQTVTQNVAKFERQASADEAISKKSLRGSAGPSPETSFARSKTPEDFKRDPHNN